jgi:hypothetical protein
VPFVLGTLSAIAVALAIFSCTSLSSPDAGGCSSPTAGDSGCVLPILAKGISGDWNAALTSAANACGVSRTTASSLWAAHVQAEVIEGFVPRAIGVDGGIKP